MAPPRLYIPGTSHHVRHRGNNGCSVFLDHEDRTTFIGMLATAACSGDVAVHGYVLMTTHYHAQVTPSTPDALPRMMQRLGRNYVRYFNKRHSRSGTLWEGRYRSSLILDENYWLTCLRYIECNPVRAGMVRAPGDYPWSSHRGNLGILNDPVLTPHPLYSGLGLTAAARGEHWAEICGKPLAENEADRIRELLRRSRPVMLRDVASRPAGSSRTSSPSL